MTDGSAASGGSIPLPRLYDHLFTAALEELARVQPGTQLQIEELDLAQGPTRLARHVAAELERTLRALDGDGAERLARQATIVNTLLAHLRMSAPPGPPSGIDVSPPPRVLLSVHRGSAPPRTHLPFSASTILTRARGEPALGHELAREVETADGIDALVSFVTVSGVRALRDALERHASADRPFRLLTTTYTGATEAEAVETLARLPHARVKVSYDTRRTRLHAKAWLFTRHKPTLGEFLRESGRDYPGNLPGRVCAIDCLTHRTD